jgi:hypothetical protein
MIVVSICYANAAPTFRAQWQLCVPSGLTFKFCAPTQRIYLFHAARISPDIDPWSAAVSSVELALHALPNIFLYSVKS